MSSSLFNVKFSRNVENILVPPPDYYKFLNFVPNVTVLSDKKIYTQFFFYIVAVAGGAARHKKGLHNHLSTPGSQRPTPSPSQ